MLSNLWSGESLGERYTDGCCKAPSYDESDDYLTPTGVILPERAGASVFISTDWGAWMVSRTDCGESYTSDIVSTWR